MKEVNMSKSSCELIYSGALMALIMKEEVSHSSHRHVLIITSLFSPLAFR